MKRVQATGPLFATVIPAGALWLGRQRPYLPRSPWFNPYLVKDHGQEEAVRLYRAHLDNRPDLIKRGVREIREPDLDVACYCGPDEPCHGDVLIECLLRHP